MSLLIRDEVGLIAANIAFHSRLGVDCFVVTDNGSIDGTRETLEDLRADFDIVLLDEPRHTMQQDVWVNRMADIARKDLGADWIINGDADEFWAPTGGSLKAAIDTGASVLRCPRANMLASKAAVESQGYSFIDNVFRVVRPFDNSEYKAPPWRLSDRPVTMSRIGKKVMCRLAGLRAVQYGNHEAIHEGDTIDTADMHVYHYPVRTFSEFLSKVINHGTSLENNRSIPPDIGWHVRRWYSLYQQGLIEQEYSRLVLSEDALGEYLASGIVVVDRTMSGRSFPRR
jgi:glycosyltransferase involved in cell wall biosynthesis